MTRKKVRVRIAPSPTGFAHVGTAYTALFNFAFARNNKGKFIIRIEDSDLKRNIKGAEQKIYDALRWLGINWDEGTTKGGKFGPYKLSERLKIYQAKANKLLNDGKAYMDKGAIRFKNPGDSVTWNDLVRGEITFPGEEITDFVILKSDGYPTYNFNVVVDDSLMEISHVIRGEDHISNTPRQIALYKAFGEDVPKFAHHPLLLNKERKKLSKRDAAVDVDEYKKQGYLPEALVNFMCLLGWSHPKEKEIFSLNEFVKLFSIDRVRRSGPIFDTDKLDWINGEYIRNKSKRQFETYISTASVYAGLPNFTSTVKDSAGIMSTRIQNVRDYDELAGPLFKRPKPPSRNLLKGVNKKHLRAAADSLKDIENWKKEKVDKSLLAVVDKNKFHTGDFFMSLRIAVFSSNKTPPVNESLIIIGKDETIKRIQRLI